jgi:hypothetical protein
MKSIDEGVLELKIVERPFFGNASHYNFPFGRSDDPVLVHPAALRFTEPGHQAQSELGHYFPNIHRRGFGGVPSHLVIHNIPDQISPLPDSEDKVPITGQAAFTRACPSSKHQTCCLSGLCSSFREVLQLFRRRNDPGTADCTLELLDLPITLQAVWPKSGNRSPWMAQKLGS